MELNLQQLLERLQSYDESQRIEAKESKAMLGRSAAETISAFSNEPDLGGGYLILGLKKNNEHSLGNRYSVMGVDDPDRIQGELASVCRGTFNMQVRPKISVESLNGKILIIAFIPECFCREKPVFIKKYGEEKGAYRRIGSSDQRCTGEDLDLLYQLRRQKAYEVDVFSDSSWEDISPDAVEEYRRLRIQIDPKASELALDDRQLLIALGHAVQNGEEIIPTIGGLLLFGSKAALRRTMPISARIDYILVEGTEWVKNPLERYYSIEYREALITVIPRLHAQIMGDLPTRFQLKTGDLQRSDIPSIPRDVIREALANALMHRDYRANQTIQIIRYSNRIEFHNPGYSLKPFDELGQAGSLTRNIKIAAVFHDLKFAEIKGTGITTMKRLMKESGLSTPPLIETDRDTNKFNLLLLPHHLLDEGNLRWLSQFRDLKLSEPDMRALVLAREVGAITNQDYRQINGVHTLAASSHLRRLRDLGLLEQRGGGNMTFYVLDQKLFTQGITPGTPHISPLSGELTPQISSLNGEFLVLSEALKNKISTLKKRSSLSAVKGLIKELCAFRPMKLSDLATILGRHPKYVREQYLNDMVKRQELKHVFSDPNHPQQAYKAPEPILGGQTVE